MKKFLMIALLFTSTSEAAGTWAGTLFWKTLGYEPVAQSAPLEEVHEAHDEVVTVEDTTPVPAEYGYSFPQIRFNTFGDSVVKAIAEHNDLKLPVEQRTDLDEKNDADNALIHRAASTGDLILVRLLVENGAAVLDKNGKGYTALELSANHLDVNEYLHNINRLFVAASTNNIELFKEGCNNTFVNPRLFSCNNPYPDVPLLSTPLHFALEMHHYECAELLIRHKGIMLDIQNEYGQTALHIAARNGSVQLVALLLCAGANFRIPDNRGLLPIDYAKKKVRARNVQVWNILRQAAKLH